MAIFRITITMPDRSRGRMTGLFACACDAINQVHDDFPEATSVTAIRVGGPA